MTTLLAALLWVAPAHAQDVGKAIYTAKCATCHGPNGAGDGPAARALPRKPADMTSEAFWTDMTEERLRATISKGKPGTAMRGFPMKDGQLNSLVAYLETFRPSSD